MPSRTLLVLKLMESSQKLLVLKYSSALDEEGNPISDPYSGGLVIDITASAQVLIAPVTAILRKAMLYNYDENSSSFSKRKLANHMG